MKSKNKTIGKIAAGIFVVGATFFGLLTSSITPTQSDSINNSNLTTYKRNKANDVAINILKSKGEITQISMSAATSSALVLDDKGKTHLYMWGSNDCAQQGNGYETNVNVTTPKEVIFPGNNLTITQISMSATTSSALVLDDKGKTHFYMWGDNILSQQGDGTTNTVKTPKEVTNLNKLLQTGLTITQISMSNYTSSALVQGLDNKTHLYMWGVNIYGQQGDGKYNNVTTPKEVVHLPSNLTITQISMSDSTSSALVKDDNGKTHLYMWGWNNRGQQGDGKTDDVTTPTEVKFFEPLIKTGSTITQISISGNTSSALVKDKNNKTHLYMWGDNEDSQQGHKTTGNDVTIPKEVIFPENNLTITQISMSDETSSALVLDDKGKTHLYMWGSNEYSQQGNGKIGKEKECIKTPKEVQLLTNLTITQISMSDETSSALVLDDKDKTHLYMWGANNYGQQGDGKTDDVTTPKEILWLQTTHNNRNYVWIYFVSIAIIPIFALILFSIYKFKNPSKNKNKPLPK